MTRVVLSVMALTFIVSLAGCNTIKGLGEDIKTVGGWISSGSQHVEESIKKNPPGSNME